MKFIDEVELRGKTVLLRVDFNVPLSPGLTVEDDQRIKACIPTIEYLLSKQCKIVLVSHLGRPEGIVNKLSLRPLIAKLEELLPGRPVGFFPDLYKASKKHIVDSGERIFLLENIRFYKEEQENDPEFGKKLSWLADVYVNDAFSVSHRADASVVGVTSLLPSYGGLLLKRELRALRQLLTNPQKPFVAILGGSKISTKLSVIEKLSSLATSILVGGGIANTLLFAQGMTVGKSICEKDMAEQAKSLIALCREKHVELVLPTDVVVGADDSTKDDVRIQSVGSLSETDSIFDIGPQTRVGFAEIISCAKTIVWNGPVGYFENPTYTAGTDAVYDAIVSSNAFSVVGGGDTLSYLSHKHHNEKLSFISTGGGAMLEYIANGSLPGIDALH
jgi:phosphoglycerate kinase